MVISNTTTFVDIKRTCNTPYFYRVRAFHPSAASAYTAVAHASTSACVPQTIYVDAAARGLDTAGDNLALPAAATTDIQGSPRRVDDPSAPDAGLGGSPQIDMGAYEYQNVLPLPMPTNLVASPIRRSQITLLRAQQRCLVG
jgi:hypothetical protein